MRVQDLILGRINRDATAKFLGTTTYPARVRVKKPPPNAVCPYLFHPSASVQENREHALPQVDYLLVLLCVCWVRGVISHGVLFGNGRYDEGWV
jgi:hypothetical protein